LPPPPDKYFERVAHELRQPLNAILTWATLIRSQKGDLELLDRGVEVIERSVKTQTAMLEELETRLEMGGSVAEATRAVVDRFNEAFNRHDVPAIMDLMTEDCVFDSTRPPPDGERIVGAPAVRRFWEAFFERSPSAQFEAEEVVVAGDRCVVVWTYRWVRDGTPGHVRGIDLFKVRDGKVAEKLSYVKG
jgi:uncharacterized protein (TIGR02246 family)